MVGCGYRVLLLVVVVVLRLVLKWWRLLALRLHRGAEGRAGALRQGWRSAPADDLGAPNNL